MECKGMGSDGSITLEFTKAERRSIERLCTGTPTTDAASALHPDVIRLWRYVRVEASAPAPAPVCTGSYSERDDAWYHPGTAPCPEHPGV